MRPLMQLKQKHLSGFTLTELVVVILILAILAGALVPRVTDRMAASRDSRRLADVHVLREAIEQYYMDKGAYPHPTVVAAGNGYDVSTDGDFIPELLKTGYLREPVMDPINNAVNYYGYNVFAQGTEGCKGKGKFYVLGIKRFETPGFAAAHVGYFKCAQKDWSTDFEFVTGAGASENDAHAAALAGFK